MRRVDQDSDLTFHSKFKLNSYEGKPGVRPMVQAEKAMLAQRPVVISKSRDRNSIKKAQEINKQVLDATNKLHSVLCGWPTFNKWTPAHKYLSKRSQCDFNFSMRTDRTAWLFPERRFVRYINDVNATEKILIESTRRVLRSDCATDVLRQRLKILTKWCYVITHADYLTMSNERVGRSTKGSKPTSMLLAYKRALSKKVR